MTVRRRSVVSRIITGLLLLAGVAVLAAGVALRLADVRFQTVLSNSMRPTFSAGDVVVTRPVPVATIRVGDVVVFEPPNRTEPVIHRITSLRGGVITTRGDANPVDDPWRVTLAGPSAYRLVAVLPAIGWLTQIQRPVLLLAGLLLVAAIALWLWKEVTARTNASAHRPNPDRSTGAR